MWASFQQQHLHTNPFGAFLSLPSFPFMHSALIRINGRPLKTCLFPSCNNKESLIFLPLLQVKERNRVVCKIDWKPQLMAYFCTILMAIVFSHIYRTLRLCPTDVCLLYSKHSSHTCSKSVRFSWKYNLWCWFQANYESCHSVAYVLYIYVLDWRCGTLAKKIQWKFDYKAVVFEVQSIPKPQLRFSRLKWMLDGRNGFSQSVCYCHQLDWWTYFCLYSSLKLIKKFLDYIKLNLFLPQINGWQQ